MTTTCTDISCKNRYQEAKRQLVAILWSDASYQSQGSLYLDEMKQEVLIWTCGYLVRESESHYSVALDYYEATNSWRYVCHIPKGMVLKVHKMDFSEKQS